MENRLIPYTKHDVNNCQNMRDKLNDRTVRRQTGVLKETKFGRNIHGFNEHASNILVNAYE